MILPWLSFSWCPPEANGFCTQMVNGMATGSMDPVAGSKALLSKSSGYRALLIPGLGNTLVNDPADKLTYQGNQYSGIWLNGGINTTKTLWTNYLQQLVQNGGIIDYLVLDYEGIAVNIWAGPSAQLAAIVSDFRYQLAIKNGQAPVISGTDSSGFPIISDYASFIKYFTEISNQAINSAIVEPLLNYFPNCQMSNYGNFASDGSILDTNGFKQPYNYVKVGTAQSPAFYGAGNQATTPYDSLVYGLNWLRLPSRLSYDPIIPWIGEESNYSGLLNNTPYYQELLYHTLLSFGTRVLFFNPSATQADMAIFSGTVKELNGLANNGTWIKTLSKSEVPDIVGAIISGALFKVGEEKKHIWRITFPLGTNSVNFQGKKLSSNGIGAWFIENF